MLYRVPSYPRRVRDAELLRSAASGDQSCLESLVRAIIDQVFPFSFALIGEYRSAQELAVEISGRVAGSIRRMSSFDNFDLWVYRLTINAASEIRHGRRKRGVTSADLSHELRLSSRTVLEALDTLRPAEREVLVLEKFEGLEVHEISAVMGCAEISVRWLLHAAKSKLRTHVERELPE
jgi:RNA polymerase sigma-70 factor, ECF subfamily